MQEPITLTKEVLLSKFKSDKITSYTPNLDSIFSFLSEQDDSQDPDIKLNELTFQGSFSEDSPSSEIIPEEGPTYSSIKKEKRLQEMQVFNDLLDHLSAHYDSKENRKPKKVLKPLNKSQGILENNVQTVLPFKAKGVKNISYDSGKEGKKMIVSEDSGHMVKECL